jgi:undecaprenol kinase
MTDHKNRSFVQRLGFALAGLAHALRAEVSLRTQAVLLVGVLAVLVYLRPAPIWWALASLSAGAVIAAELFNTAVEQLADHVEPQLHPQIRIVKDCAAAAVLSAALGTLGVAIAFVVELVTH